MMRIIATTGLFLLVSFSARADLVSIQLSGLPQYQYFGYYVGPAQATDGGAGPFDFWCDDFTHETVVPTTYYADASAIPSTTARFAYLFDSAHLYQEVAWLIGQYYAMGSKTDQSVGDLQFAIWLVFDPNETSLQTPGALTWLTAAQNVDFSSYNTSGIRIFTPTNCSGSNCVPTNQEFIDPPPVPEPTSILLLGPAALLTLLVIRRRRGRDVSSSGSPMH